MSRTACQEQEKKKKTKEKARYSEHPRTHCPTGEREHAQCITASGAPSLPASSE